MSTFLASKVIRDNGAPLGRRKTRQGSMAPRSCQMYDSIELPTPAARAKRVVLLSGSGVI